MWAGLPKNCEGILVVIDYAADVAKTAAITRLLGALDACPIRRQRILFLEREHLWVGRLLRHTAARIALERAVFERDSFKVALRPVVSTPASRADSFERAQDAFATRMGVRPNRGSKPQFDKKLYDQVLLLHTQALLSVVGPVAASREDSILTQLLERERDYWQRLSTARGMGRDMLPVIEQVCRLITLHRGVGSIEEGFDLTLDDEALSELAPIPRREVLALLRECYPSGPSGIGPLEPDLLGQKLVTLPPTLRRRKKP
ncbi:MAG: hypothetical protein IT580_23010 [Verrucomicrobiales bacterium]|nr:hypothetical protein [Verrucomicrobiales bacterium]